MKILKKEWCAGQELDLYEFVCETNEIENLPTNVAKGSMALTPDGIYMLYDSGWDKFGGGSDD